MLSQGRSALCAPDPIREGTHGKAGETFRRGARQAAGADDAPPVRPDRRLKKIFFYSEGTFVLNNAAEVKKLVITTSAFDVGGWLDLSKMRDGGDEAYLEIHASFANRSNVLYRKMILPTAQLLSIGDLAPPMAGNHIEIWLQQTKSKDNFATKVEFAYQIVVESQ